MGVNATKNSELSPSPFLHYYYLFSSFSVLLSNIVYFLVLVLNRKTNKRSYIHIHHINLIGLLQGILIASWSFNSIFALRNQIFNRIVCFLSEILWGTLKHVRAYSVMSLALFRYSAVFHNLIYKKISSSYKYIIFCILLAWIIPTVVFFIMKYSTELMNMNKLCFVGTYQDTKMIYIYFFVNSVVGFVIPSVIVCIIYAKIRTELRKRFKRLKIIEMICPFNSNTSSSINQNERIKRNKRLMKQVILINLLEIISFFNIVIMSMPIQELFENFDVVTLNNVLGSLNNFILAIIPFVTLYFMPFKLKCKKITTT